MQSAAIAAFFHCCSSKHQPKRGQCPVGDESWCKFQRAKASNIVYQDKSLSLPQNIVNTIKPVYMDLCDRNLLKKCLHGKTQNPNESFNAILWQILPKEFFVEHQTLRLGAYIAVVQFNNGFQGLISILNEMGIVSGFKGGVKERSEHVAARSPVPGLGLIGDVGSESQSQRMVTAPWSMTFLSAGNSNDTPRYLWVQCPSRRGNVSPFARVRPQRWGNLTILEINVRCMFRPNEVTCRMNHKSDKVLLEKIFNEVDIPIDGNVLAEMDFGDISNSQWNELFELISENNNFKYKDCKKVYSQQKNLNRHIKTFHSVSSYICAICKRTFNRKDSLRRHQSATHGCPLVQTTSESSSRIREHRYSEKENAASTSHATNYDEKTRPIKLSNSTRKEVFNCFECGKVFYQRNSLNQHVKTVHASSTSFLCPVLLSAY
ncbi:uncharacterized protein TNCV_4692791 [Trichonephila clavipes]|nr:uncharacterized protein TNCV_4692791 [Trichonephila clavipes]